MYSLRFFYLGKARFNFSLCHQVHRQFCRTHFHGSLQGILRITDPEMPNVHHAKYTFLDLVRYVIIFHITIHSVFEKWLTSEAFTILDSWVKLPHKERWICKVTRQSFQGWQVPFVPSFSFHSSSPFGKVQKSVSYPRDNGKIFNSSMKLSD